MHKVHGVHTGVHCTYTDWVASFGSLWLHQCRIYLVLRHGIISLVNYFPITLTDVLKSLVYC